MQRVVKVAEILNIVREGIGMRSGKGGVQGVQTPIPWGELPYEGEGDAYQKLRIKTLKETNLFVAQALFDP